MTDEELLSAARAVFQREGHAGSTRAIAKAAGVSQAVLFQRFGSKEQLFFAAMIPEAPDIDGVLGAPSEDARRYLEEVVGRLLRHFRALMPAVLQLSAHPAFDVAHLDEAHRHLLAERLHRGLADRLRTLRHRGEVADAPCDAMATTIIAVVHSLVVHEVLVGSPATESRASAMVDILWRGIRPERG
ncbi:MAG: helix-turn-helix domain-containing protein [Myxococcota bacterium]